MAYIHEKLIFGFAGSSPVLQELSMRGKDAEERKQRKENWHDFNHGMIVGEYLWVSGMITGTAGLPDTVETLVIALNERGGVAVAGDLALGIINSVKETWTEFQDGDVKDKGRVIGRLIPDAILAGMAAVKGIKSFKAARLTKTETTVTVKNGVETVEDLGENGAQFMKKPLNPENFIGTFDPKFAGLSGPKKVEKAFGKDYADQIRALYESSNPAFQLSGDDLGLFKFNTKGVPIIDLNKDIGNAKLMANTILHETRHLRHSNKLGIKAYRATDTINLEVFATATNIAMGKRLALSAEDIEIFIEYYKYWRSLNEN